MQQPSVVAYVQPSVVSNRRYRGIQLPKKRRVKVFRGGQPVRSREEVLQMVGRKV